MIRAFIAVGSNLGNRSGNLSSAKSWLEKNRRIKVVKLSPVYQTEPVGGPPQGKYLNAVWEIAAGLKPRELLGELLKVEILLGRRRKEKNAPRTLDLDLLFYGNQVIHEPGLEVPHPRLHQRAFVLKPLADIAPDWIHPELGKTIKFLWEEICARSEAQVWSKFERDTKLRSPEAGNNPLKTKK